MFRRAPTQVYALTVGGALVLVGVGGFFYSAAFGSPGNTADALGILTVNGWENVAHIATGAPGLLALSDRAARLYALGAGLLYVALAIWGAVAGDGHAIASIVPVNTADTVLHGIVGVLGLGAYATTQRGYPDGRAQPAGA